jgi:serralysin
VPIGAPITVGG